MQIPRATIPVPGPLLSATAAVLATAMLAAPAWAQPGTASALEYVRAAGAEACDGPVAMARRVEALLGTSLVAAARAGLAVEVLVQPTGDGGFSADLRTSGPDGAPTGQRQVRAPGPGCDALAEPLSLVIAIGLDPDVGLSARAAAAIDDLADTADPGADLLANMPSSPVAQPQPRAKPAPGPATDPAAAPDRAQAAPRLFGELGVQVGLGYGPPPALGLHARLALRLPAGPALGLTLAWLLPREITRTGQDIAAEVSAFDVGLSLCSPGLAIGSGELSACLGPFGRLLRTRGMNFARNRPDLLLDVGAAAAVRMRWRLGNDWGLNTGLVGQVSANRHELVYGSPPRALASLGRYGARLFLGVDRDFL